ncbi:MAG: hypothetical protein RL754_947 [Bacteroidota bacterium]|jgi:polyisoprenoid-binding protein YceI
MMAQRYMSREATIEFEAGTGLEPIEAITNAASAAYDESNSQIAFQVLMTTFQFEKKLMREHFLENYVESEKFPKASFKGTYNNGTISGDLTIHGITKSIEVPGELTIDSGNATLTAAFSVLTADYGIEIPSVVKDKVAKSANIKVSANLKAL